MSPSPEEIERSWFQTGQAALTDGDERFAEDDFDGACRRFLVAAYCFARAWCASSRGPGVRHEYQSAFCYAVYAAQPLLPDRPGGPGGDHSHSSSTRSGSPCPRR